MLSRLLLPLLSASLFALAPPSALRAQSAPAQPLPSESGLYLSATSYSARTLEHAIDCRTAALFPTVREWCRSVRACSRVPVHRVSLPTRQAQQACFFIP